MILVQATALLLTLTSVGPDSVATARRISASAELAAQEYRIGVVDGVVVMPAEVDEARLFLGEARRTAGLLPLSVSAQVVSDLDLALSFVARTADPDSLDAAVARISATLTTGLGVTLVEIPAITPSLVRGADLYRQECASCHGVAGRGDGSAGIGLDPAPADLGDAASLADVTPLAFYQRVTIGVAGTAMPSYETRLPAADRWAVAVYATMLRQAEANGRVPQGLTAFATTAGMNDLEVLEALGPDATPGDLASVRSFQPAGTDAGGHAALFAAVKAKVAESDRLARDGDHEGAVAAAFDAYLAFEAIERTVRTKDAGLATELEASFATLRTRAAGGATANELDAVQAELLTGLERAERVVADDMSPTNLFIQSLMIMVREGLEAILIIGALIAFLVKVGAGHRKRDIHIGVGAAVALSLLTAVLLETVFQISPAKQEVLEGITMLAAVGVLFYVSYWLLSKMEVERWTSFVKERVQVAVTGGSAFALVSAAFLAVYREGFETVLFYKALFVSGGSTAGAVAPVVTGIIVGGLLLALVYVAINKYGVKLPLKPFFGVTSAFLYYTAFVFAGKGIAELQAGGAVGTTVLPGWPRLPTLGIYPTVQSMLAQGTLVFLAAVALGWIFIGARRRSGVTSSEREVAINSELTTEPTLGVQLSAIDEGPGMEKAMLRSLEQMEGDLAALKGEVERMRDTLLEASVDEAANRR
jgi:high-affinity iron transporter